MTENFKASNGIEVWIEESGVLDVGAGWVTIPAETNAIREFFQHERDKELGRWRDPEYTHMVVYPLPIAAGVAVMAVDESSGVSRKFSKDEPDEWILPVRRYFEAHHKLTTARGTIIRVGTREFTNVHPGSILPWLEVAENGNLTWWGHARVEALTANGWELILEGVKE